MVYGDGFLQRGMMALENLGITDVLLPFLLVFTVVFAVLHKSHILGEQRKNMNIMIALLMSLAVVIPHLTGKYPADWDVVNIINAALPNVSLVIIAILMVMLLVGLFGGTPTWIGGSMSGFIALVCFVVVVYIFGAAANIWTISDKLWFLSDPDTQALVVVILVFGILVYFITKEDTTVGFKGLEKISEMFQKPKS